MATTETAAPMRTRIIEALVALATDVCKDRRGRTPVTSFIDLAAASRGAEIYVDGLAIVFTEEELREPKRRHLAEKVKQAIPWDWYRLEAVALYGDRGNA